MSDDIGDRMKDYESVTRIRLTRRTPALIRVDGKAFHTLTRWMNKPFDVNLQSCMQQAAIALCEKIQGAKIAYVQSDEISVLLTDYDQLDTQAWFNYQVQKMASVAASIATAWFNIKFHEFWDNITPEALFDGRVWSLPKEEVVNYFIWRQQDASRNSVQMVARAYFSHDECHNKNNAQLQDMLHSVGINWNNYPTVCKRGSCIIKENYWIDAVDGTKVERSRWVVDREIPIFTQNREYIEKYVINASL